MIQLEKITKRYGSFDAVKDVSLHVKPGEVFGFLGPNGAGKTTTMRMLVGLIKPSSGRLFVDGINVVAEPIRARQVIGYIPDRPYLYEKLTAREFLNFVAGVYGLCGNQLGHRIAELLELFGLSDWSDELIESYSHGMKQRLTMAAAVLHRPKLLVVDEPMVGLDPRGAVLVKNLFRRMVESGQGTVFLSTHTLEVAQELCERVAILQKGQICALGTVEEIRNQVGESDDLQLEDLFLRLTGGIDVDKSLDQAGL